jgi:hypothetical protein
VAVARRLGRAVRTLTGKTTASVKERPYSKLEVVARSVLKAETEELVAVNIMNVVTCNVYSIVGMLTWRSGC